MEKTTWWMMMMMSWPTSGVSSYEGLKNPDTSKTRKMRKERARELTRIRERQLKETKGAK